MRQAELQDKRDRIRMGLIPPDAPKGASGQLLFSRKDRTDGFDSSIGELDEGLDFRRSPRSYEGRGTRPQGGSHAETYPREDELGTQTYGRTKEREGREQKVGGREKWYLWCNLQVSAFRCVWLSDY